jgi:hypothetical protein
MGHDADDLQRVVYAHCAYIVFAVTVRSFLCYVTFTLSAQNYAIIDRHLLSCVLYGGLIGLAFALRNADMEARTRALIVSALMLTAAGFVSLLGVVHDWVLNINNASSIEATYAVTLIVAPAVMAAQMSMYNPTCIARCRDSADDQDTKKPVQ